MTPFFTPHRGVIQEAAFDGERPLGRVGFVRKVAGLIDGRVGDEQPQDTASVMLYSFAEPKSWHGNILRRANILATD
jgi:hypothetical protein